MGTSASDLKRFKNAFHFALRAVISAAFADALVARARTKDLTLDEHFTVGWDIAGARAGMKGFSA
jgi:hypothetical protein